MRRLSLTLALGLAACGPLSERAGYRDGNAPIAATTRFEPARFAGDYRVVAAFAPEDAQPASRMIRFEGNATGGLIMRDGAQPVTLDLVAPGRLRPKGEGADIWVLWTDADYRTAALGTPSGRFGMIIERGDGAADRMVAAREILEWYGYDLSRLVETKMTVSGERQ